MRGSTLKILFLDIETSPNTAHVWGLWNQTVGINQLLESSYVLCWAAKWADSDEVMFDSVHQSRPRLMVKRIHNLLEQADMVVHYHGSSFDIPTLNKEFISHKLAPPSPYKEVDLLKTVRKRFKFTSNKLDYVAHKLGLGKKHPHEGHSLWIKCMNNDPDAWAVMEAYNRQDVKILEQLYHRLLPWIKNHPNLSAFHNRPCCPNCGSHKAHRRGYALTQAGKYQRYQCQTCHAWYRNAHREVQAVTQRRIGL
jgi:uncharacterized protein YprB with RNaseH-like and TPR domain